MATITRRLDDLTGEELPENVRNTIISITDPTDGRAQLNLSIDLSDVSHAALLKSLAKYVKAGQAIESPAPRVRNTVSASSSNTESGEIRAWALANPELLPNGVKVSERGALPKAVKEAYAAWLDERDGTPDSDIVTDESPDDLTEY